MLTAMSHRLRALFVTAALALVACGGQPSPPAQLQAQPIAVAAPAAPTAPAPTAAPAAVATTAPAPTSAPAPTTAPTLRPTADPIAGAPGLARGALKQRPYAVMIDNHPDAYPQAGLDHAVVVFEALAEFGVTRFMAVLAPGISPDAPQIGPVRSTRLYFAQWAMGFHALYAHAGGSPQGLALVESTDQLINLDALHGASSAYFARGSDRDAPHNLYTSSAELARAAKDRGVSELASSEFGFLFKDDAPTTQRPQQQRLDYFFIYREDSASWTYDRTSNGYRRWRRGKPARDAATDQQLWAKNVAVIEVREAPIAGDEKGRIEQEVVGSGRARVFVDGVEREVRWRKDAPAAPLRFFDASDDEVRFNAGPVWIVALPSLENLTVK